jgi:hypothetical protein
MIKEGLYFMLPASILTVSASGGSYDSKQCKPCKVSHFDDVSNTRAPDIASYPTKM